jgi:hypothetical protein
MGYYVLTIYMFECDRPDCEEFAEVHPWAGPGKHRLAVAERELRHLGWQKNGTCYFCPRHKTGGA